MTTVLYNDTQKFPSLRGDGSQETCTLTVQANGGAVELQKLCDPSQEVEADQYQTYKTYTADEVDKIYNGSTTIRIVPSGGATYNLER